MAKRFLASILFVLLGLAASGQMPLPVTMYQLPPPAAAGGFANTKSFSFAQASTQTMNRTANDVVITTNQFWRAGWFKTSTADAMGLDSCGSHYGGTKTFQAEMVYNGGHGSLKFSTSADGSTDNSVLLTTGHYNDGAWHHWTYQYDSANATATSRQTLKIDGTAITVFTTQTNSAVGVHGVNDWWSMGVAIDGDDFDGLQDEMACGNGMAPSEATFMTGSPGQPKDLSGVTKLFWLRADTSVVHDEVMSDWTNHGVTQSSTVP